MHLYRQAFALPCSICQELLILLYSAAFAAANIKNSVGIEPTLFFVLLSLTPLCG